LIYCILVPNPKF